jgi:hypothetical protein
MLLEINRTDYTDVFGRARWPDAPHRVLETPLYVELKKNLSDHETEENQSNTSIFTRNRVSLNIKDQTTILVYKEVGFNK